MLALPGCMAVRSPLLNGTDLSGTDFSTLSSAKSGDACQTYFLIFPVGREKPSLAMAIQKANIKDVMLVEYTTKAGFLTMKDCVTVYGH